MEVIGLDWIFSLGTKYGLTSMSSKLKLILSANADLRDEIFRYWMIVQPMLERRGEEPFARQIRIEMVLRATTLNGMPRFTFRRTWNQQWQPYWRSESFFEDKWNELLHGIHGLEGSRLQARIASLEQVLRQLWETYGPNAGLSGS